MRLLVTFLDLIVFLFLESEGTPVSGQATATCLMLVAVIFKHVKCFNGSEEGKQKALLKSSALCLEEISGNVIQQLSWPSVWNKTFRLASKAFNTFEMLSDPGTCTL